jgi:hypothetical protein
MARTILHTWDNTFSSEKLGSFESLTLSFRCICSREKRLLASSCPSVCPRLRLSAYITADPTGRIFVIGVFDPGVSKFG